jgi:hypothetical protein
MPKATKPSLLARSCKASTKFAFSLFTRRPYSTPSHTGGYIRIYAIEAKGPVKQFHRLYAVDSVDLKSHRMAHFGALRPSGHASYTSKFAVKVLLRTD